MCVIPFILDVRLVDVPAGIIEEEDRTGFLHLSSAVLASIFLARRIQPFLSLVDPVKSNCVYKRIRTNPSPLVASVFVGKNQSQSV